MSKLTVTAVGVDALGQLVTASATAVLLDDRPPCHVITETIEIEVDASRLLAFAGLVERHAAAIRRDLEKFMAREEREEERE